MSLFLAKTHMTLWRLQNWTQCQMSHVTMSFYVLGSVGSLLTLIGMKMYGVNNMQSVFWTLFLVSLSAAFERAIRPIYNVRIYHNGETAYGFFGAIVTIFAFLVGTIR